MGTLAEGTSERVTETKEIVGLSVAKPTLVRADNSALAEGTGQGITQAEKVARFY